MSNKVICKTDDYDHLTKDDVYDVFLDSSFEPYIIDDNEEQVLLQYGNYPSAFELI